MERFRFYSHGDFWSQVPVVALAAAAVIALVLVNGRAKPAAAQPGAPGGAEAQCGSCTPPAAPGHAEARAVGAPR